ncbi:spermatogenesis- and oogenesis-specific basic helix-loop-helix-containing protein 1 [Octodon degus]|uniref:Spermatogenesis- and oogenesis-specific basic helix-loop-helix-containing protein 1 n=1 Tax=Octodon degus TaxID=10160 RepID=A0A6P3FLS6_OCTDE|nr:spermatogenesis- and oogenesis-specific basic helix-loop-helix-containing protein 1 [Octodon degus]
MASRASEPKAGLSRTPGHGRCQGSSAPRAEAGFKDPVQGSGPRKNLAAAKGEALPRNVLSERGRRKRISVSCERLRALLPRFDGRREDMATVLEMAVQFLRLARSLVPSQEQHLVPATARATWHTWQGDVLQWALASQVSAGRPDPGTAASSQTLQQEPLGCASQGAGESKAPAGLSEQLGGLPALPGVMHLSLDVSLPGLLSAVCQQGFPWPSNLGSRLPPWPSYACQLTSPKVVEDAAIRQGLAGPPARSTASPSRLAGEVSLTPAVDSRSAFGLDPEDGESFPLSASPDLWLGSVEARLATPARASARSSPVGRAELGFPGDPVPSSQELQDSPLELWGSDVDAWGLDLKDDGVDSIFTDFLAS